MIITSLENNLSLYKETLSLIEDSFGYNKPFKFDIDFYPLMEKTNWGQNYIILNKKGGDVLGHIGVNLKFLKNKNLKTPIALIGGISIHKNYRGKGLFKYLMNHIIETHKNDVSLFVLWSDLKDLYNKFDFYEAGSVLQTGSKNLSGKIKIDSTFTKTKLSLLLQGDINRLEEIYESFTYKNLTSLERNKDQWKVLKKISSSDLYLYKRKGKIFGYFFANKGLDLQNIIHEYAVLEKYQDHFFNLIRPYKLWIPEHFPNNYTEIKKTFLAFFRIGSKDHFIPFIEEWSQKEIKVKKISDKLVDFVFQKKEYSLHVENFLPFLFGPSHKGIFSPSSPPLYFSGLESI